MLEFVKGLSTKKFQDKVLIQHEISKKELRTICFLKC